MVDRLFVGLGKLEFSVQVLTTGHWPYYKNFDTIQLPPIMQRCTQARIEIMCIFGPMHATGVYKAHFLPVCAGCNVGDGMNSNAKAPAVA